MIMANFKTTFVAIFLLCFSYSFLTGCAQQYEYDYSADARLSNWQSSRTNRGRNGNAPSRFDVKNSSPDIASRNRPRTESGYEDDGIVRSQYETARQFTGEQSERGQTRGRHRSRQRVSEPGRTVERRVDEVTESSLVSPRRRLNRVRVTESTTQATEKLTARLRAPMEDTQVYQPRGFSSARDGAGRIRQRVREETATMETSTTNSPRSFSRGRVKAKIYDSPRRSSSTKADEISESDNYPAAFIQKIKSSESQQSQQIDATPRRSRLRQRAAKTYPAIALSEANRFRQRYTIPTTSTQRPQTTTQNIQTEETELKRNNNLEERQRNRGRYTTPRITTDHVPKPFRTHSRRFSSTEKNENSNLAYTTTISPRQKYLSRLRTGNKQFNSPKVIPNKVVEEEKKKEEALESAENSFYVHPDDSDTGKPIQMMANVEVDLESDASEEDERIETEKTTEGLTTSSMTPTDPATTVVTTTTSPATNSRMTPKAGASLPSTRHRFSSRFSRSNKTTGPEDAAGPTPETDSLVLDIATPAPINLTSLFDDSLDSTILITALFNNSFNASSSVATNKMNSPETLINSTAITSTERPSTVTENSSRSSSTSTTRRTTKKKSQKKSRKLSKSVMTPASPIGDLNDRPILRNIVSLFGNVESTTKRSSGKRKSSRTRTTTTTTSTPAPQEIAKIQSYISETKEVIHNRSAGPAPTLSIPRLALNALTPETSMEEATTVRPSINVTTITIARTPVTATAKTAATTTVPTTMTTARTTTSTTVMTSTASTSTAIPAPLSSEIPRKNCTSQFVYFDYNSSSPVHQKFDNSQRKAKTATTTSTTPASTTADYFVYGVYPNNTIVRKRAWKAFDYEKYQSPYVIFGIYPNNTIIKKFPNGTIINDEFMTSDNEIRDIMGLPRKPTTTTTTKQSETTSTKPSEMRMAGSGTTENIFEEFTTEEENPDSMFEIIENEIEREESKDEELNYETTESPTTVSNENIFRLEELLTTEVNIKTTTEQPSSTTEDTPATTINVKPTEKTTKFSTIDTTPSAGTTEATDIVGFTTQQSMRGGKSFSFNELFKEDIIDSTTERIRTTTTGSSSREATETGLFDRISNEIETEGSTTAERTIGSTESTGTTTEDNFNLQKLFQTTTTRYDSSRSFDIDLNLGDGPVYRPFTTEAAVMEGSTVLQALFDPEQRDQLLSTTDYPSTSRSFSELPDGRLVDSTTVETPVTSKSLFDLNEIDFFGATARVPSAEVVSRVSDNNTESTAAEVSTTSAPMIALADGNIVGSTTSKPLTSFSESDFFGSTTVETPTTGRSTPWPSESTSTKSTITEVPTTLRSLTGLSENAIFESTTNSPTSTISGFRQTDSSIFELSTTEISTAQSLLKLSASDLFGSTTESATTDRTTSRSIEPDRSVENRLVESTTEIPTTVRSLLGLSETNLFDSATTETPNSALENTTFTSPVTERRNFEEFTTVPNTQNEISLLSGILFQLPDGESSVTKSTMRDDEQPILINLAYRALGSSHTITTSPTPTTTKTLNYITSTMKSTNFKEKKVRMKMKRTSTSTPKSENVFIVTPETTISETEFGKKGKVKFVTLTPGVIVTTDVRDENDVITMSSQHVQKVTKAPANIPDNFLTSVVGEIQKSSSPVPDILKNVEKELQGNGISVSLARRIIEMAIERAVSTEVPQISGQFRETTLTNPYDTTTKTPTTTAAVDTTTTPTPYRIESTTSNEMSTAYNDFLNTVNLNPLSVEFISDYTESTTRKANEDVIKKVVQGLWKEQTQTTTLRTTTTTKSSKRTKSSRNPAESATTLSQNDKLLLEAILKQQNSKLSVQELDKIIENQIRLAEEVRKASKNMKKKPRVTTTTTTTTQTPPLFGFLISLFSGNSSPSNIPVTRSPVKQTRSRLKTSRGPASMTNNPKTPDPLKEAEAGNSSGERSSRGELVTAAIDVTKAVSKFMGTFLSSAAQSFQAFFSNFGRGR